MKAVAADAGKELLTGASMGSWGSALRGKRLWAVLLVGAALVPSARLAWEWRRMPHLGIYHDDSLYFVTGRAWAEGKGHTLESFPGEPAQTKYPPVWPLVLSAVWRLNPRFPDNLPLLMLVVWMGLPLFLAAAAAYFRDLGFKWGKTALICAWLAVNPVFVALGTIAMAELWFGALLVAAVVSAERLTREDVHWGWAVAAGILAALAALTRSAGVLLLLTAPAGLMWRRRFRRAALFLAIAAPPLAVWNWWKAVHYPPGDDLITLYYTNYAAYRLAIIGWGDPRLLILPNLNSLLTAVGKLFVFFDVNSLGVVTIGRVLAVGAVVGLVRLVRRTGKVQFALFAFVYGAVMLVWHFPPNVRFVVPVAPLLAAGVLEEGGRFVRQLGSAWTSGRLQNRIAAAAIAALLLGGAGWAGRQTWYGVTEFLPASYEEQEGALRAKLDAYSWIRRNTPPRVRFFANDDAVFYLYTGREACSLAIPPDFVYRSDEARVVRFLESLPEFAERLGIRYAMFTPTDSWVRPIPAAREAVARLIREGRRLRPVYAAKGVGIYEVSTAPESTGVRTVSGSAQNSSTTRKPMKAGSGFPAALGSAGRSALPPSALPEPSSAVTHSATLPPGS